MILIPLLKGTVDFARWLRCLALVVKQHHRAQPAWPATKIATVK
jgi:hypothetical protein